jgi:MYXO-CTERM domain-containing protein
LRRRVRQIAIAAGVSLACFALPLTAEANDYLVSNAGSDDASGLSGSPWQTLQRAWQSVKAGDTVTAEDGTYAGFACDSVSGTAVAPIVFKSRNPLGAKINAPGADVGSSASQDYIQLSSCSFVIVDGFEVSGAPRSGIAILGNSDDGSDAQGVIIQNCYSHANGGTTVAGRHDGIFSGFALNLTIQDNRIDTTGEHGIYVSNAADNPSILRNDVSNTGANCIQINADLSTGGDGLISNWLIEGNTVRDCHGSAGFNLDGVIHGVARNNLIYNAAKAGITLFQGDGAEASHDNLIVNNTVYDPSGSRSAIQVADGADNNVLFNNIFISGSTGLEVQTVSGLVHDYNLISSISGGSLATHESSPMAASLFIEPMTGNLRLSANSPAIDHGVASLSGKTAPSSDLLGATRPAGADYDIGAYEDSAASDAGGSGGATGAGGSRGGSGGAESDAGAKAGSDSGGVGGAGRSGGTGTGGSDGGAADAVAGAPKATQGGCSCRIAGPSDGTMALWLALATAGAAIVRRRRSRRGCTATASVATG